MVDERKLLPLLWMSKRDSFLSPALYSLGLALCATGVPAFGQTEVDLDIETYAGLRISGEIEKVYSVEYVDELGAEDWRCLEFVQLLETPFLWTDKSVPVKGTRFYRAVQMEPPENMVFIPPGTFRMGSPEDEVDRYRNEGPRTTVTISQGYWMGQYEVTQGEYWDMMGNNPSWFQPPTLTADTTRPVERVSWNDAMAYCAALTQRERAVGRIRATAAYRLPTEAEWEYACRAWTSTRFSYEDDPGYTNLTNYAWYWDNSSEQTHPVGLKLPNLWGLYDMHGNVLEWCWDWWDDYPGGVVLDPHGPDVGFSRVIRGGDWGLLARHCRSAFRSDIDPHRVLSNIGFRVVLAPGQP